MDTCGNKRNDAWREEGVTSAPAQADSEQSICRGIQPQKIKQQK